LIGLAANAWLQSREESLPNRFRLLTSSRKSGAVPATGLTANAAAILARARKWVEPGDRQGETLVALVAGEDITGAKRLLYQAGFRKPGSLRVYRVVRIAFPLLLLVLFVGYGKVSGVGNGALAMLALCGAGLGMIIPPLFLQRAARKRQEAIRDALPDALDLLVVCVEAGLGLSGALVRISDEFRLSAPVLSEELDVVNREMVAGKPRVEALRALSDRTGVEDVQSLVAMLVQTEKLGTSLAQSLRVHSDSLRTRRRQRAEEAAAKTTIKLVFPLVFLIFPALFIVILGPGVIQIMKIFFPVMKGN
ncbi:MAG TPA: type II secretion system F family protein, partial [Candidatus Deferrimicrobiaceae bacterium]